MVQAVAVDHHDTHHAVGRCPGGGSRAFIGESPAYNRDTVTVPGMILERPAIIGCEFLVSCQLLSTGVLLIAHPCLRSGVNFSWCLITASYGSNLASQHSVQIERGADQR